MSKENLFKLSLYGIPVVLFLLLETVYGFNGLYGQDSHEYLRYAMDVKTSLVSGTDPGEFYWPKLYSTLGAFGSFLGLTELVVLRFISLVSILLTIHFTRKIIEVLWNKDATLFLILGAVTQVYFIRMGFMVMTDALCGSLIMGTILYYVKIRTTPKSAYLFGLLGFALLAFFSRYASIPLLVLPVLGGAYLVVRSWKLGHQFITLIIFSGALILALFFNNRLLNEISILLQEWNPKILFHKAYDVRGKHDQYWVPNIMYALGNFMHIGFLSLGVFLLPFYKNLKKSDKIILFSLLIYILFIGGLAIQNYRFLVISHPLVLILLYPAFDALWTWLKKKKISVLFLTGTLAFNMAFFVYSFSKTYKVHLTEKEIVTALKKLDIPAPVYTFYIDQSFRSYGLKNEVRNMWMEEYQSFEKGALVVFNESKFEAEWKGQNVMINWDRMNTEKQLIPLAKLDNNWTIYRIN